MNKITLIGRLGKEPKLESKGETKWVTFSVATSERYKDRAGEKQERTTWFNCKAFGSLAEIIGQYCKKGDGYAFEGKVQEDQYDKDGETKRYWYVVVDKFEFLPGKKDDGTHSGPSEPTQKEEDLPF